MSSRCRITTAFGLAIVLGLAPAWNAIAQSLTTPEAVGILLFPAAITAMPKAVSEGRVTYRGNTIPGEPERTVLSIAASRADPCLFEAFFIEAPAPTGTSTAAATTAYTATIDLRKPDQATFHPVAEAANVARLTLRANALYCSRSIILEQTPKLILSESCVDAIDDNVTAQDTARMRAAFENLRLTCRW